MTPREGAKANEAAQDWRYDGLEIDSLSDATIRPYGWLDVTLGPNSTLSYVLPMVATPQGYDTDRKSVV